MAMQLQGIYIAMQCMRLQEGQHGPHSGKACNNWAYAAATGGGNVCSCEGGRNMAMQL
jgi:hypothetical protein